MLKASIFFYITCSAWRRVGKGDAVKTAVLFDQLLIRELGNIQRSFKWSDWNQLRKVRGGVRCDSRNRGDNSKIVRRAVIQVSRIGLYVTGNINTNKYLFYNKKY